MRDASPGAPSVLVFGDDCRSFLAVVRSLGRQGIRVHAAPFDIEAPALRSRYITRVHELPTFDRSESWIEAVECILEKYRFELIIPCCDRSSLLLDRYRGRLKDHRLALHNDKVMFTLFDKYETKLLASRHSVPVPRGRLLAEDDTLEVLVREFRLPLVIRPRRSYRLDDLSRRSPVKIIRSREELKSCLAAVESARDYLVEAYVIGVGIGISIIANDGETLCAFQHRRIKASPSGGASSLRVSETVDPVLLKACRAITEDCRMTGVAMFEFRLNPQTGRWVLLEVNARFWGSLSLPVALRVDFPMLLYGLLVEGRKPSQVAYAAGARSRNLVHNAYHILRGDMPSNLASFLRLTADIFDLVTHPIKLGMGREISDTFQIDDWRPGFFELARVPSLIASRIFATDA